MAKINGVNCIVDTNYILYRNVYILAKNKQLYGNLERSLESFFQDLLKKYPFQKIYMVCDSKKTWRKDIYSPYKEKRFELRQKDDIDWEFVYNTYNEFKSKIQNRRIEYLELEGVEGDDIIRHLITQSNKKGISTLTIASDVDITQTLDYSILDNYINIQWHNKFMNGKVYLPLGYKYFINDIKEDKGDLFNMNENQEFLTLYESLIQSDEPVEVNKEEMLFVKIIHGDTSDNIESILKTPTKSDITKLRGIGKAGAEKIFNEYKTYYPKQIDFISNEWIENVVEFVVNNKKVDYNDYEHIIINNIKLNRKLIHLHENHLPTHIKQKIDGIIV